MWQKLRAALASRQQQTLRLREEFVFDYQIRSDWCDALAVKNHINQKHIGILHPNLTDKTNK